jgi:hypothetical protein
MTAAAAEAAAAAFRKGCRVGIWIHIYSLVCQGVKAGLSRVTTYGCVPMVS